MAYLTDSYVPKGGSFLRTFGAKLKARKQHTDDRREYARLIKMNDRILKDVGLSRDDVRERMLQPFHWTRA